MVDEGPSQWDDGFNEIANRGSSGGYYVGKPDSSRYQKPEPKREPVGFVEPLQDHWSDSEEIAKANHRSSVERHKEFEKEKERAANKRWILFFIIGAIIYLITQS